VLPKNILESKGGRLTAFSLLYLTEGIPFGFSAIALVTYLRQQGVGLTEIGAFTAMLYFPWGFKWAWGPVIDLIRPARLGPRRFWIVFAQIMMIVTLGVVWILDPGANLPLLTALIAVHNVFASMQDVAIDALAVQVLPEDERGVANGFMFGASYLGQTVGGSGALVVAGLFGFKAAFPFVLLTMGLILVAVSMRLAEPPLEAAVVRAGEATGMLGLVARRVGKYVLDIVRGFFLSGPGPALGVVFGLMPFGAVALGLALGSTMQVDLGMTENQIARLNLWGTIVAAIGCIVGGWVSDRLGHRRMLGTWFVLTVLPTIYLSGQFTGAEGMEGVTIRTYFWVSIVYSFFSGLIFGTSAAVFMGLTSPLVAATQFSGYMALRNLVYSYSAAWQGHYADAFGYARTLRLDAWIAFIPLLAIPFLKPGLREPVTGAQAAGRLRAYSGVFVVLCPVVAALAGDWRAPDRSLLALAVVAAIVLGALIRGVGPDLGVRLAGFLALAGAALFVGRYLDVREWARATQLTLGGALSAFVAAGLLAAARYELRKAERTGTT
jgi:MFS family permease